MSIPAEQDLVSAVIAAHPNVATCSILGPTAGASVEPIPLGPRVRAEIVLGPGIAPEPETAADLARWCEGRLPAHCRPAVWVLWPGAGCRPD